MSTRHIGRRTFLRGAGGIAVGLPMLEIMLNDSGTALADGSPLPCRYFTGFGGFSLRADNGTFEFRPDNVGPGYDLKPSAMPLSGYGNVKDEITIVSNLRIPHQAVDGGMVQPGGSIGFHWHCNPLLTGNRQLGSAVTSTVTGPSTDQIVAEAIGNSTAFRNLNYRAQAAFYIVPSGVDVADNRDTMSFDPGGTPIAPTVSPRLAYESLFTGFDPSEAGQFALRKRQSVLDLVERRTSSVLAGLGAADQQRMDEHYTQIRELEMRLEAAEDVSGACTPPPHPGDDPPLSGNFSGPTCSGGVYDPNAGYSGEYERTRLLSDFIHMAFTCDLTRVACLMYSMFQSFMNAAPLGGENRDVHATYHLGQASGVVPVVAWHMDQFAYFVSKLRDTAEGDGSLLDHCALVFMIEGGAGVGPGGSESHTLDEMCWLTAGGAGGLRRGEHIAAPDGTHPVQVLITAMNAVGVDTASVGEVSGSIPQLLV